MSITRQYLTAQGEIVNLSKPTEKQRKADKAARKREGKDPAHIAKVKACDCIICGRAGPSDAHHVFCGRYSNVRAPDKCTIPLCKPCHQWGPLAIHNDKAGWVERNGPDYEYIAATLDMIENGNGPTAWTA